MQEHIEESYDFTTPESFIRLIQAYWHRRSLTMRRICTQLHSIRHRAPLWKLKAQIYPSPQFLPVLFSLVALAPLEWRYIKASEAVPSERVHVAATAAKNRLDTEYNTCVPVCPKEGEMSERSGSPLVTKPYYGTAKQRTCGNIFLPSGG